ncbi:MAG: hypothetical protein ACSLFI_12285 [Solirubrobacterales bacterium]
MSIGSSVLFALLSLLFAVSPAAAQNFSGSLDQSFGGPGSRGIASIGLGDFDETTGWIQTASLPNGSTLLLTGTPFQLSKIGSDGKLVDSFGDSGVVRIKPMLGNRAVDWNQVFAAPDGGVVLIGQTGVGQEVTVVNRLLPNGKQNKSFGHSGPRFLTRTSWGDGGVDEAGRIILTSSGHDGLVTRLKPSGALDKRFGDDGTSDLKSELGKNAYMQDVLSTSDGVYIVANTGTVRLYANGNLDRSFGENGFVSRGGSRISATTDGVILQSSGGGRVYRLTEDGSPYPGYGPKGDGRANGRATTNSTGAVLPDGSLIFIDDRTDDLEDRLYDLSRIDPNGMPDPTFAGDGTLEADWLDGTPYPGSWTVSDKGAAIWGGTPGQLQVRLVDQSGNPSPTYGDGGTASIRTSFLPNSNVTDAAQRKDLSYLTVGTIAQTSDYNSGIAAVSVSRNGKPEQRFGDGGRLVLLEPSLRSGPKPRLTLLPSGGALICAKVGKDSVVWRISREGELVQGFGTNGRLTLPFTSRCQDISFDGIGGVLSALEVDESRRGLDMVRVLTNGTLDGDYGVDGIAERTPMADLDFYFVHSSRLLADRQGRTLLIVSNGDSRYISRYTSDGFPDPTFGFKGKIHYGLDSVWQGKDGQKPIYLRGLEKIEDTALGPNGTIFISGTYKERPFVGKLGPSGFPVRTYGKQGVTILPESKGQQAAHGQDKHARVFGMGVRPDGSVIVTGRSRPYCVGLWRCNQSILVKRVKPNGKVDRGFSKRAHQDLKPRPDATGVGVFFDRNRFVVAGSQEFAPGRRNFMLARFR